MKNTGRVSNHVRPTHSCMIAYTHVRPRIHRSTMMMLSVAGYDSSISLTAAWSPFSPWNALSIPESFQILMDMPKRVASDAEMMEAVMMWKSFSRSYLPAMVP